MYFFIFQDNILYTRCNKYPLLQNIKKKFKSHPAVYFALILNLEVIGAKKEFELKNKLMVTEALTNTVMSIWTQDYTKDR